MSDNLKQLDPNYVVAFDYSKGNVAQLVSEFAANGLAVVTRPGHNSKTVYAFTRVEEPSVLDSGEVFTEKHGKKKEQERQHHQHQHGGATKEKLLDRKPLEPAQQPASIRSIAPESLKQSPGIVDSHVSEKSGPANTGRASNNRLEAAKSKMVAGEEAEESIKGRIPGSGKLGGLAGVGAAVTAEEGSKNGLMGHGKGGLKGIKKDELIKDGKQVVNDNKDGLTDAGQKAVKGDKSQLESQGKKIATDAADKLDKDHVVNTGKKLLSGDKKDIIKNGKKAIVKNQLEHQGKNLLSGNGIGGAAAAAEDLERKAGSGSPGEKPDHPEEVALDTGKEYLAEKYGTSGVNRTKSADKAGAHRADESYKSVATDTETVRGFGNGPSTAASTSGANASKDTSAIESEKNALTSAGAQELTGGGRATLFAVVASLDFVQSVTPIYDIEKRKRLESTVNTLVNTVSLTSSDRDLINLEHLTRNPREILYFFYFKNYIRWLLPISLVGVVCRLFSRSVAPWEFNITYTVLLIVWSLLFTGSWAYYYEPLYASKLGKVLSVVTSNNQKLNPPHVVLYKKFCFIPVALLFALCLVTFQFLCFFIEIFVTQLYSGPLSSILALLPTVLISAFIPVITMVYNKFFVDPMVAWENGPNPKKSKSEKNYVLTFLTSYVPLFITLFFYLPLGHKFTPDMKQAVTLYASKFHVPVGASQFNVDINRYKKQFFFYTVTSQIINMVVENILPLVLDNLLPAVLKDGDRPAGEVTSKLDSMVHSRYPQDYHLWKKVESFYASNYGEFDEDRNYSKLVVQFGYIAMFSTIWPLAPFIFTIFDLIIFRTDLWRAFVKCKPSSDLTDLQVSKGGAHKVHVSSAPWDSILEKITYLGSVVSVALLLMYRYSGFPGVGLTTGLEKRDSWYKESPLVYSWSNILLVATAVEHLVLLGYIYFKDILISYQTKFEPVILPSVNIQKPIYTEEVDETAAVMEQVAHEFPVKKNEQAPNEKYSSGVSKTIPNESMSNVSDAKPLPSNDVDNVIYNGQGSKDESYARTSGYNDGFRDGIVDSQKDNDKIYSKDISAAGAKLGNNDDEGVASNAFLKPSSSTRNRSNSSNGVSRNRSTKRSSTYGTTDAKAHPSEKSSKESRHYHNSNSSTQGDGKGTTPPHIVADSQSREIPVQSYGKSGLNSLPSGDAKSPSKSSKSLGSISGLAETSHSSNRPNSSYLENNVPDDDAGATLPETIPTSKNYHTRYDKNGKRIKPAVPDAPTSASVNSDSRVLSENGPVGEVITGAESISAGGLSSDLKSGEPSSAKLESTLQQEVEDNMSAKSPLHSKVSTAKDSAQQGTENMKDTANAKSVENTMKTLDPAAVAKSVNNVSKDPSTFSAEATKIKEKEAPLASTVFNGNSKGAPGDVGSHVPGSTTGSDEKRVATPTSETIAGVNKSSHGHHSKDSSHGVHGEITGVGKASHDNTHGKNTSHGTTQDAANVGKSSQSKHISHVLSEDGSDAGKTAHVKKNTKQTVNDNSDNPETAFVSEKTKDTHGKHAGNAKHTHKTEKGKSTKTADPESPAAQQFGRDVPSITSAGTFGTAESKIDNLTGAIEQSEVTRGATGVKSGSGSTGTPGKANTPSNTATPGTTGSADALDAAVTETASSGARKTPVRSATQSNAGTPRSKGGHSKSGTPSRSKTIGHSSQSKGGSSNAKTADSHKSSAHKGPKSRSSNPELRTKPANGSADSKSKHKSGFLHRMIKKLE
ncbi:uncharacterized protein ZBAI_09125 [Zygosaccharomyces bailii ISA1307]|nr:uncharacterized protein ZBAI_09125 [Zygosaccharomyces bailii ISA1307]